MTPSVDDRAPKLAVTGKGGVGKTTLAAAISRTLATERELIAVDGDPDMNLAEAIGIEQPDPITQEAELVEERAGGSGGLVKMRPPVDDVLDTHSTAFGASGRLITIGPPGGGGTGCMCAENNFIRTLLGEVLDGDAVVMDMEAGIEHLGRGTARDVDAMVVVVEPTRAAVDTAHQVRSLAADVGVDDVSAVVNKVRTEEEAAVIRDALDLPVLHTVPYDEDVAVAGLRGTSPVEASAGLRAAARSIVDAVEARP